MSNQMPENKRNLSIRMGILMLCIGGIAFLFSKIGIKKKKKSATIGQ